MTSIQHLSKSFIDKKTTITTISSFSVTGIFSTPYQNKAMIYVTLYTTDNEKLTKTITICDKEYLDWVSDDYIYLYISDRIEALYHQE